MTILSAWQNRLIYTKYVRIFKYKKRDNMVVTKPKNCYNMLFKAQQSSF